MTPTFASFAIALSLLAGDGLGGDISTVTDAVRISPTVDVAAGPAFTGIEAGVRSGGQVTRIELDNAELNAGLSAWYRLAYLNGGTRLQLFEHYAATTRRTDSDIVDSQIAAWTFANEVVGSGLSDEFLRWAWIHTGNDTGSSAGLIFTLAYIDLLTSGKLVGNLRVAGTGTIGADGVVIPVTGVEVKVAAALLSEPDVVFTPNPSELIEHTTIVESQHTRIPTEGHTVSEWLNLIGYEQAGRDAANHPGTVAYVVVHDIRQALAFLCGRTNSELTCTIAHHSASLPIGTQ
jgi:hypothetical protein